MIFNEQIQKPNTSISYYMNSRVPEYNIYDTLM